MSVQGVGSTIFNNSLNDCHGEPGSCGRPTREIVEPVDGFKITDKYVGDCDKCDTK